MSQNSTNDDTWLIIKITIAMMVIIIVWCGVVYYYRNTTNTDIPKGDTTIVSDSKGVDRFVTIQGFSPDMYLKTVADTFGGVVNKSDIGNGFTEVSYGTGRTFIYRNISSAKSVNDMLVGEWFAIKTKDCLKEKYDDAIYEPVRNILDYSILSLTDSEKDTIRKSLKSAESCFSQSENTYLQKALGF